MRSLTTSETRGLDESHPNTAFSPVPKYPSSAHHIPALSPATFSLQPRYSTENTAATSDSTNSLHRNQPYTSHTLSVSDRSTLLSCPAPYLHTMADSAGTAPPKPSSSVKLVLLGEAAVGKVSRIVFDILRGIPSSAHVASDPSPHLHCGARQVDCLTD